MGTWWEPPPQLLTDRETKAQVVVIQACVPASGGWNWSGNVLANAEGAPVLVDPAVSDTWPEVDLGMLWCSPPQPGKDRFFDAYAEVAPLHDGWRDHMELMFLREVLSIIAHGDDDWGADDVVRRLITLFRRA